MPFIETYAIDFSQLSSLEALTPQTDTLGWQGMQSASSPAAVQPTMSADEGGLNLAVTRDGITGGGGSAQLSIYVAPPIGSVPLRTRLFIRATFDRPQGVGFGTGPIGDPPGNVGSATRRTFAGHGPSAAESVESAGVASRNSALFPDAAPEPWALGLNVAPSGIVPDPNMINVTCQFHRNPDGVRLNTPTGLQLDQPSNLESPLDYGRYQGGYMAFPDGTDGVVDPPIFTLEHSFCGWGWDTLEDALKHNPGAGFLKINRTYPPHEVWDHRAYSTNKLRGAEPPPVVHVGAVGVTLVTQQGFGRISVRLRTFSVSFNPVPVEHPLVGFHALVGPAKEEL